MKNKIKKFWKNVKNWQRGIIIAILFTLINFIVTFPFCLMEIFNISGSSEGCMGAVLLSILACPTAFFHLSILPEPGFGFFNHYLTVLINYLFIGILIGGLIDFNKSMKKYNEK